MGASFTLKSCDLERVLHISFHRVENFYHVMDLIRFRYSQGADLPIIHRDDRQALGDRVLRSARYVREHLLHGTGTESDREVARVILCSFFMVTGYRSSSS